MNIDLTKLKYFDGISSYESALPNILYYSSLFIYAERFSQIIKTKI